jgi:hypothetical protein
MLFLGPKIAICKFWDFGWGMVRQKSRKNELLKNFILMHHKVSIKREHLFGTTLSAENSLNLSEQGI